jgi:hypothetical protein
LSININKHCRICESSNLTNVINLGNQALTGVFENDGDLVQKFNMSLSICDNCGLTQINEVYDLNLLYGDGYGYESSLNASMIRHLESKAKKIQEIIAFHEKDIVIDIGSNDAISLKFFPKYLTRIGVDYTGKKFQSNYDDIDAILIPDFYPTSKLLSVLQNNKAKYISSYSCFYDLPDPVYFAKEIHKNLAKDGLWCLEQSYMPLMLEKNSFDTICHEHIEYYTLTDIKNICDKANLKIIDVDFNDINGGSFSVLVGHIDGPYDQSAKTKEVLYQENQKNWKDEFISFNERINNLKIETLDLLNALKSQNKRVVGIGASTKGNVLLQYYNINDTHLDCIGEVNSNKYGCKTPGSNIPIVNEDNLLDENPDYLFILPWHFKEFFLTNKKFQDFSLILPLPELTIIEKRG